MLRVSVFVICQNHMQCADPKAVYTLCFVELREWFGWALTGLYLLEIFSIWQILPADPTDQLTHAYVVLLTVLEELYSAGTW